MKKLFLMAIILCTCATFFCHRDTGRQKEGRRTFEARLSNVTGWEPCRRNPPVPGRVVQETECGTAVEERPAHTACTDEDVDTHADAQRLLSTRPECTDDVIDALVSKFARFSNDATNDLAVAYYVRAQRQDQPLDFLRSLAAADDAVEGAPSSPTAWFNRALAQEALHLTPDAIASWDRFLALEHSPWADEARVRRDSLVDAETHTDAQRWQRSRNALRIALQAGDRTAVERFIEPFPSAAERYFEEELLPEWAAAPTPDQLDRIALFASVLSARLVDDPFPTDVVAAITRAANAPEKLASLRQGHLAFLRGRQKEVAFAYQEAAAEYKKAVELLAHGNSPLGLRASLGLVATSAPVDRARIVDEIDRGAQKGEYRHLRIRVHWMRAHDTEQTRYTESLREYRIALAEFFRLRDYEGMTAIYSRIGDMLLLAGHRELAWRHLFYASRHAGHLMLSRDQHALSSGVVSVALALGFPAIALLDQNAVVATYRKGTTTDLAIAVTKRATILIAMRRYALAAADLAEADRLLQKAPDANVRRLLQVRNDEGRGQDLLQRDPQGSVKAFTAALANVADDRLTQRTALRTQRAAAELKLGRISDAERDLRDALAELHSEQTEILNNRKPGEAEELWPLYFARFQDTHRMLIRLLMESNRAVEAYAYSEQTRGIEPLDLMRQLESSSSPPIEGLPRTIDLAAAESWLARVQRALPAGTFIIQYSVLADRTYAWVVSRDRFQAVQTEADAADLLRWNRELQQAVRDDREGDADVVLRAAFEGLVAQPLAAIDLPHVRTKPRLVFITDAGLQALPMAAFRTRVANRYVIDLAPVEFDASTTLYLVSLQLNETLPWSNKPSVLAIGDPAFDEGSVFATGMDRLEHAKTEAEAIHLRYGGNSEKLIGAEATVPAFLAKAPSHPIVHIAAHAVVNPAMPSRSYLLLAHSPHDVTTIDAEELLTGLKHGNTRLFVLAACSSASGLPLGAEGVAPLVRSLLATGAPAVVGALWNIGDATTETLMVSFHRHYEESGDAAVAMQAARRELLNKNNRPDSQSVFAWAPFQVIGHTSPPTARASHGGTSLGIHSSNSLQRPDRLRPQ
jgi:CHAT domain-containing protein